MSKKVLAAILARDAAQFLALVVFVKFCKSVQGSRSGWKGLFFYI